MTADQDDGLPNTVEEVTKWVTCSHRERKAIPIYLRSDCGTYRSREEGKEHPESNPAHLHAAARDTLEGHLWLCHMIEYFRSERSFAARLACIIQRSGIKVRHVQSTLSKEELTAQRVATKGAKSL